MKLTETGLAGAYLIEVEPIEDKRGFFARAFDRDELAAHGLETTIEHCNVSWNGSRGTIRGLHYQRPPYAEAKIVRCTRGAIFDVIVDIREGSPTFGKWFGAQLDDKNRRTLYVPPGFAHGYQTLTDDTEVFYMVTMRYTPEAEGGFRWDDPAFAISWPLPDPILSDRDRGLAPFEGKGVVVASLTTTSDST